MANRVWLLAGPWSGKAAIGAERQRAFKRDYLRIAWVLSSIDLSYPGLVGHVVRRYASNAFGVERTTYR
jgi:hypothetical protein